MTKKRRINYFIPVAVIAGLGLAIYTSSKTWKVYQAEKDKATQMRAEIDTTRKSDAKLRRKDQIMNPVQKEEEARRLGYVRPEETPLPDKKTDISEPPVDNLPPKAEKKPSKSDAPIDLKGSDNNEEVQAAPR
jgi:hypothetical protein